MTFRVEKGELFKNDAMRRQGRSFDAKKARKVADAILSVHDHLPLAWDKLTCVELVGECFDEDFIEARLHFGEDGPRVVLTSIAINKKDFQVLISGTNYDTLIY